MSANQTIPIYIAISGLLAGAGGERGTTTGTSTIYYGCCSVEGLAGRFCFADLNDGLSLVKHKPDTKRGGPAPVTLGLAG